MSVLQDCFKGTDWKVFKAAATENHNTDVEEYAEAVSAYIQKFVEDDCVVKNITTRANQKPWMTNEVRAH